MREDGKIDVTLRLKGQQDVSGGKQVILDKLKKSAGFLPGRAVHRHPG